MAASDENPFHAANLASFATRRGMVVHEDAQINARLNALLFAQSFLFSAVVILIANSEKPGNDPSFYWLAILVAVIALVLGHLSNHSIAAAQLEQAYVLSNAYDYEKLFPFTGPEGELWRRCLQAHSQNTLDGGFGIARWFPRTTSIGWLGLMAYAVCRIYDWQVASGVTLAATAIVAFAFGMTRAQFSVDKVAGSR